VAHSSCQTRSARLQGHVLHPAPSASAVRSDKVGSLCIRITMRLKDCTTCVSRVHWLYGRFLKQHERANQAGKRVRANFATCTVWVHHVWAAALRFRLISFSQPFPSHHLIPQCLHQKSRISYLYQAVHDLEAIEAEAEGALQETRIMEMLVRVLGIAKISTSNLQTQMQQYRGSAQCPWAICMIPMPPSLSLVWGLAGCPS
jgi:hypothetical protein